jgi:copper chaperone
MVEILVSGMTCNGCVKSVTNALKAVDSEAQIDVNLTTQTIRIQSKKTTEVMAHAIVEAGFSVISSKSLDH